MKSAIIVGVSVVATIGVIIAVKRITAADTVPVVGAGIMKLRAAL